jgi:peptidoglycan-associated lipoprotein
MIHTRQLFYAVVVLSAATLVSACAHNTAAVKADASPVRTANGPTAPLPAAASAPADASRPERVAVPASFQDIFFDFEKAQIREDAKRALQEDAKILLTQRGTTITIGGYCDERGTDEYNLVLGNRRAEAVKHYLVALGVDPAHLKTVSYGKEKPFCTEHTEACYQENRRGHFIGSIAGP